MRAGQPPLRHRTQSGKGQQQLTPYAGAAEEAQSAGAASFAVTNGRALLQQVLESDHIAHGRLGQQRRVVQWRPPSQFMTARIEPQGRFDLRPKKCDPVQALMQGGEDEGELQSLSVGLQPFLGERGVLRGDIAIGRALQHRALLSVRRTFEQTLQKSTDPAPRVLLIQSVQKILGQVGEGVGGCRVRPSIAERVVPERVEEPGHLLTTRGPRFSGYRRGVTGPRSKPLIVCVELDFVLDVLIEVEFPHGPGRVWRVPGVEQLLLEGPGTEVVDLHPVPQPLVADEHRVESVGCRADDVQGGGPTLDIPFGQLQSALPGQFGDLVGLELIEPGFRSCADQGRRRCEHLVELHLDPVGFVHDHDVTAQARQLQVAQAFCVELSGHCRLEKTRGIRHPDQRIHEVPSRCMARACTPDRTGVRIAQFLGLRGHIRARGLCATGMHQFPSGPHNRGLVRRYLLRAHRVQSVARRIGMAQWLRHVQPPQRVQWTG